MLRRAIIVQPLPAHQIGTYLLLVGEQLSALRSSLQVEPTLQEPVTSTLVLSVLMLAYHGQSVEALLQPESLETQRQQVLALCARHMLQQRGAETHYTVQQTLHRLAWLVRRMTRHSQTEFYIEGIPHWLVYRRSLRYPDEGCRPYDLSYLIEGKSLVLIKR